MLWYQQRDCQSLVMEFSDGKPKQKGFFHSVAMESRTPIYDKGYVNSKPAVRRNYPKCGTENFGPGAKCSILYMTLKNFGFKRLKRKKADFPNAPQSTIEKTLSILSITCVYNAQIINIFFPNAALLARGIHPSDRIHERHF
jgi:hypothetical protein